MPVSSGLVFPEGAQAEQCLQTISHDPGPVSMTCSDSVISFRVLWQMCHE